MRGAKAIFWCAVALAVIQVGVIGQRIAAYEKIVSEGKEFRFRTDVVDPYDIFRGRFVSVSQENLRIEIRQEEVRDYDYGSFFYGQLKVDEEGFASIASLSKEPTGGDELKVEVTWAGPDYDYSGGQQKLKGYFVNIKPPFDRYYIKETLAPAAEREYRAHAKGRAHLSVRVLGGKGVLEELYIEGVPVKKWLESVGSGS